jgi:hypothetical protein
MSNVTKLNPKEITRTYPVFGVPAETVLVGEYGEGENDTRVWYEYTGFTIDEKGTVHAHYKLPVGLAQDADHVTRANHVAAERKAHSKYMRDTKPMRDAKNKKIADAAKARVALEDRCGTRKYHDDRLQQIFEYQTRNSEGDSEAEYIAFLEKIAPTMEGVYVKISGFKSWAEFEAADEAWRNGDEDEAAA